MPWCQVRGLGGPWGRAGAGWSEPARGGTQGRAQILFVGVFPWGNLQEGNSLLGVFFFFFPSSKTEKLRPHMVQIRSLRDKDAVRPPPPPRGCDNHSLGTSVT